MSHQQNTKDVTFWKIFLDAWPVITAIVFMVYMASSIWLNQQVLASKISSLESMSNDIQSIKIKVERIDERVQNLSNKGK